MPTPQGPSGLVVVDKPAGLTSHDVVGRIRRIAGTRKVGHAGTLDPMATGVLLVGVNRATRLLGHLMLTTKAYDATVRLGVTTTTDDAEGTVLATAATGSVTDDAVRAALHGFVGDIDQVPSSVSAIKVDGKRAYAMVRDGEQVELRARPVTVHTLDLRAVRRDGDVLEADISVTCSSGTYIRAIARDLGAELGVGGHLTGLRRTAVGPFGVDEARTLEQLAAAYDLVDIDAVAARSFPTYTLTGEQADDVAVGRKLETELGAPGPVALLTDAGRFLALYEQRGPVAAAVAVFTG